MSVVGTKKDDMLFSYPGNDFMAGMAGNDVLTLNHSIDVFITACGGGGDDLYIPSADTAALIADSGGNDVLALSLSRPHIFGAA